MLSRILSNGQVTPRSNSVRESMDSARTLILIAAPMGVVVGAAIAAYDWVVNELLWTHVLLQPIEIQIASPALAMLLAGLLLQLFRVRSSSMADEVVGAYHHPSGAMPTEAAGAKLAASIATMGLGASAGMEGASKWLGATIGSLMQRGLNKLGIRSVQWDVRSALLTGGSAGIAAIFRAPLSGAIMGVESPYKQDIARDALLSSLVAAATSFWTFTRLRPATPYFPITFHYTLVSRDLLIAVPLGISAGLASNLFLWTLARLRERFNGLRLPIWARTFAGGVLLAGIAWIAYCVVGKPVTLQSGLPVANDLLNGKYALLMCLAIFALKLLATSITFGAGGVGGLFVPTATIGAALGACWDALLAPSHPGLYTLLGIAAFSGASYSSILFAAVFIAESTGSVFLAAPALIASTFAYVVAAGVSNSRSQKTRREGLDEQLATIPIRVVMSTQLVAAFPAQTLEEFARTTLLEHHFKALPVVDSNQGFKGMIGMQHLRTIPMAEWKTSRVADVFDINAPTLGPNQSLAEAESALLAGPYDYIPIVDPATNQLVGIISLSDVLRARNAGPVDNVEPAAIG